MKAKRLLWAVVALFATFSMTVALSSCGDKGDEPGGGDIVVPEDPGDDEPEPEDKPEVANPAADQTTFLFQIENASCAEFELYLMGIGGVWEDTPEMKFSRVEGTTSWFQVTVPAMDVDQANFKIRANGEWTYEPKQGYEFLDDAAEYVQGGADGGNPNNLMMLQAAGGKVIALKVIEFVTPCAETFTYKITLKTTYCGTEGTTVGLSGNITGCVWDGEVTPMEQVDENTYTYTVENGLPGMEFKFQSTEGSWANQPIEWVLNEETGAEEWNGGLANNKLGDELDIVIDLTDAAKYVWSACKPE
ncbi:MAG: hypothetical protein UIC45_04210 [Paludibacteraceae bacterium]|nr:hypothetical protein [Paludibacteraceae bacterium]